jgi:hypothetical protein
MFVARVVVMAFLSGIGIEPANRFFPDRTLVGWTGHPSTVLAPVRAAVSAT